MEQMDALKAQHAQELAAKHAEQQNMFDEIVEENDQELVVSCM